MRQEAVMTRNSLVCSACVLVGLVQCAGQVQEVVDPRVRSYVAPTRVVWTSTNAGAYGNRSKVENAESNAEVGILDLLNTLFSPKVAVDEKKKVLSEKF